MVGTRCWVDEQLCFETGDDGLIDVDRELAGEAEVCTVSGPQYDESANEMEFSGGTNLSRMKITS